MTRKVIFVFILVTLLAGSVFAQKHQPSDMLLGFDIGLSVSPNISGVFDDPIKRGNYAATADLGINYDYYLFSWLSFNTGVFLHPDIYAVLDQDSVGTTKFTDVAASPLCLTFPIMAHINVPVLSFLYAGAGLTINIPIMGMFDNVIDIDTKGDPFVGIPIDVGFDFIKAGKGGSRFFFRVTPEIHKKGTTFPIGFIWQIYNFKIH